MANNETHHKLFDNKYSQLTYLSYLCRDNQKYIMRTGEYVPNFIICTIDGIIRIYNTIYRRGSKAKAIENIKDIYEHFYGHYYTSWYKRSARDMYNEINKENLKNEYCTMVYNKLKKIIEWQDKFEDNYEDFKKYITSEVKEIDDNHYDWLVGDNIIYDRSLKDNATKKTYCSLNNPKIEKQFKEYYFSIVNVPSPNKAQLFKQINYLLIVISDVNNLLIAKKYNEALDILDDYLKDNYNMNRCLDIYYLKIFNDLTLVKKYMLENKNYKAKELLNSIVLNENAKYSNHFKMYESVAIDLTDSEYVKVINI